MGLSRSGVRILGLAGVLGGLTFFVADMLVYFSTTETDVIVTMSTVSDARVITSGVVALVATWLYVVGVGQVSAAFSTASSLVRYTVVACFVAIFVAFGVVHGAYLGIAATAKLAAEYQIDLDTATSLTMQANDVLRLLIYPVFALLSVVFISQVWMRRTLYPRWMILFFPLIPFLFEGFLKQTLTGLAWMIIVGGFFNLLLVTFFSASTVALWRIDLEPGPREAS